MMDGPSSMSRTPELCILNISDINRSRKHLISLTSPDNFYALLSSTTGQPTHHVICKLGAGIPLAVRAWLRLPLTIGLRQKMFRRKKNAKKGIQFSLMVCGASGTGPSDAASPTEPRVQWLTIFQAGPRLSTCCVAKTFCHTRNPMTRRRRTWSKGPRSSPSLLVR